MKKKEKIRIIQCQHCIYYDPIEENAVDGICKVSKYWAYRKWNHSCERAVGK